MTSGLFSGMIRCISSLTQCNSHWCDAMENNVNQIICPKRHTGTDNPCCIYQSDSTLIDLFCPTMWEEQSERNNLQCQGKENIYIINCTVCHFIHPTYNTLSQSCGSGHLGPSRTQNIPLRVCILIFPARNNVCFCPYAFECTRVWGLFTSGTDQMKQENFLMETVTGLKRISFPITRTDCTHQDSQETGSEGFTEKDAWKQPYEVRFFSHEKHD